jgi:beta-lactamase regulating signal transducer with metallopeptidase domain
MTSNYKKATNRKLLWLWSSLIVYLLFMFIAWRYALTVPYQVLALGGVINMAILLTFIFAIRRVYVRSRGEADLKSGETREVTSGSKPQSDRRRLR